ncbi:hypothetical protein C8R47DRAFT_1080102 [Mycena vitilis]|nr:hypothetical protein C8R47DRAFT_1080102 [Mycena vitilis]
MCRISDKYTETTTKSTRRGRRSGRAVSAARAVPTATRGVTRIEGGGPESVAGAREGPATGGASVRGRGTFEGPRVGYTLVSGVMGVLAVIRGMRARSGVPGASARTRGEEVSSFLRRGVVGSSFLTSADDNDKDDAEDRDEEEEEVAADEEEEKGEGAAVGKTVAGPADVDAADAGGATGPALPPWAAAWLGVGIGVEAKRHWLERRAALGMVQIAQRVPPRDKIGPFLKDLACGSEKWSVWARAIQLQKNRSGGVHGMMLTKGVGGEERDTKLEYGAIAGKERVIKRKDRETDALAVRWPKKVGFLQPASASVSCQQTTSSTVEVKSNNCSDDVENSVVLAQNPLNAGELHLWKQPTLKLRFPPIQFLIPKLHAAVHLPVRLLSYDITCPFHCRQRVCGGEEEFGENTERMWDMVRVGTPTKIMGPGPLAKMKSKL